MMKYLHLLFSFIFTLSVVITTHGQKFIISINLDTVNVNGIAFSHDGKLIAGACNDKVVRVWNVKDGAPVNILEGHKSAVLSLDFSPDGKYLASAGWDKVVKIWDVENAKVIKNLDDNKDRINCVRFSPDGSYIASASEEGTVMIWSTATWRNPRIITHHKSSVNNIAFSNDSRYIATASWDKTAGLFEVATGSLVFSFAGHLSGVNAVSFSNDGWYLASGSDDRCVNLWDIKARKLLYSFNRRNDKVVYALSFNPISNFVVSANENSSIDIWDVKKMKHKTSLTGHKARIHSLIFMKEQDIMASASDDKTIMLWDMSDLRYEQCYEDKMNAYAYLAKPKDEFETTEQYNSRLEQFAKVKEGFRAECEIEFASRKHIAMQANFSWVNLSIQSMSDYNADKQEYIIMVNNERYPLQMPVADAKKFKDTWNKAKVRAVKRINPVNQREDYINMRVTHPVSQINYPFGMQIDPAEDQFLNAFLKKFPK